MSDYTNEYARKGYRYLFIFLVLVIIILLLMQKCGGNYNGKNGIIKSDTVVQTKVVTRIKYDTLVVYKNGSYKPQQVPKPTLNKKDTIIKEYIDSFVNNDLAIFYKAKTKGDLLQFTPTYRLKQKTLTITKDSIYTITKTITNIKERNGFYVGLNVAYNAKDRKPDAGVGATFVSKKGVLVGYNYLVFSNIHTATVQIRLFPRKK